MYLKETNIRQHQSLQHSIDLGKEQWRFATSKVAEAGVMVDIFLIYFSRKKQENCAVATSLFKTHFQIGIFIMIKSNHS